MTIKAFAFDLDGTILENLTHHMSDKMLYTLTSLRENGYKLAVNTSRSIDEMNHINDSIYQHFDIIMCATGSATFIDNKLVEQEVIDHDVIVKFLKFLDDHNILYCYSDENNIFFINEDNDDTIVFKERFARAFYSGCSYKKYNGQKVTGLFYYYKDEKRYDLQGLFADVIEIVDFGKHGQVLPKNIDKGYAMKVFANNFDLQLSEIAAFGDGDNDISMFKVAGRCFAMSDSRKGLLKYATDICATVGEDGVYEACVKNGYIKKMDIK